MTLPSDRSPSTESVHPGTLQRIDEAAVPAADLVFIQDGSGQYLSFYWRDADRYGLKLDQMIGKPVEVAFEAFKPIAMAPYLERIRQVLSDLIPLRFEYSFEVNHPHRTFELTFELTVSPILMPHSTATSVLVMGNLLRAATGEPAPERITRSKPMRLSLHAAYPTVHSSSDQSNQTGQEQIALHSDQKRLTELIWKIRRTLDLETIWQQTVAGLGEAFGASRCLICPYMRGQDVVVAAAEYCQPELSSLLDRSLSIVEEAYLGQALTTLKPIACSDAGNLEGEPSSIMAIAACYQDQPNGLIILYQTDRGRVWSEFELDLLREIADQVGTGIAHASLYAESQNLAFQLQRVNDNLMQKHQELEEARQQAEAASRLKSEFLANTSHELRTPLNGVIGFLKLIMDGMADDPAEQTQFLQEAHRSAIHLLDVINDILDIAKIEAGKMQLDLNPIPLDELLNDVLRKTRPQAQQKNLSFEIRTPETRDEVILHGNYQRLLQVMLNLVGNAIKFTHEGGVTISAEVISQKAISTEEERRPGIVKISVADTGIGVSLEKQDKLFQSFSQVDGSRTRQYGGTGLGLAISQKLVEAMGGEVNFYSMGEGLGSTVTFTVPLFQDPLMVTAPLPDTANLLL
ncbi:GAF domain-containing sensor histidine kinase [Leptolyngbya ohadii]|uniref:GAF domain-containing sensor histidine kinase n=1 Tax=Leptolyngbya ohadii TaxID=1962290 RepID=UPI000B59F79B|nr:ATP-binding protein [Leptolyngbya ohadii]